MALGQLKDTGAVAPLITLLWSLEHNPQAVKDGTKIVANALQSITDQDFGEDTTKWRAWWEKQGK